MTKKISLSYEEAWDLIPWFINETLGKDEARAVAAHLESCSQFAAEVAMQRRLAQCVQSLEINDARQQDSLRMLESRITPRRSLAELFAPLLDSFWAHHRSFAMAACALVALIVGVSAFGPGAPDYQTLTEESAPIAGTEFRLRVAPETDLSALREDLLAAGAATVSEPSDGQVVRVIVNDGDLARLREVMDNHPAILFVATD